MPATMESEGATTTVQPLLWEHLEPHIPAEYKDSKEWDKFKAKPETLFKSLIDTRKMVGESLQLPKSPDDAEGWKKVWSKLGAGEKAEDYAYDTKKWDGKFEFDQEAVKRFQEKAHSMHMPKQQYEAMMDWYITEIIAKSQVLEDQDAQSRAVLETKLRQEYGLNYDYNKGIALRGLNEYVQDAEAVEILHEVMQRNEKVFRAFVKLGGELVEHKRIEGVNYKDFGGVDPKSALDEINKIRADRKHAAWDPKAPGWKEASEKLNELYKIAYPEK